MSQDIQHLMRPGTLSLSSLPPLSVYVHLPWCLKKCPYCDFNSHEWQSGAGGDLPEQRYLDALCADLEHSLPLIWGRAVHSIFIGGGTPSLFSPASIDRLISDLRARLNLEADCEITLEANPGTFEKDRFKAFRAAGVTRLSIGVQSFNDAHLKALGRVHDRAQALAAVEEAANAFDTFNLDLMYALPGQTLANLEEDLNTMLAFEPPHVSVYHLTIEPNTVFAKFPPPPLSDAVSEQIHETSLALLKEAGYRQYEVSAFAKPACEGRHNLNYWEFGDYLGIGAGAHSKWTNSNGVIERGENPKLPRDYMAGGVGRSVETIDAARLPFEFCLNALRLSQGFTWEMFEQRTGLARQRLQRSLESAERRGLVVMNEERVCASGLGYRYLNDVLGLLLD